MAVRFQLRRDTAANWTSANSVLALGEPGVETDTLKVKVGDGSTAWNSLGYSITKDFTDLTNTPTTLAAYGITDALSLAGLSVTQNAASGSGAITYNNATGVFSYTPPNFEGLNGNFTGSVFADDSTIMVDGVAATLNLANNTTTDLTEGTNLYYTDVRADARIAAAGITDLSDADQTVQTTDNVTFSSVTGNVITTQIDSADSSAIEIQTDVTMLAGLTVGNHIVPSSSENIDLGSPANRFRTLYLAGETIDLGGVEIKKVGNTVELPIGASIKGQNAISAPDQELHTTDSVNFHNITTTGHLRGPASFVIDPAAFGDDTGTVVIAGNLQVDGTQTTINSTTVSIDDLNFSIATDAADSAAANGAGITIGGAGATLNYTHATTSWDMNKPLNVTGDIGVSGTVDGVDIAARDAILTSTTTTAGAALPKAGGTMTGDLNITGSIDASGLLKVGTNDSEYANNYIRFKPTGAAYIDHNTVGQDINFRTSVSSSLDTTPFVIKSAGNVGIGNTTNLSNDLGTLLNVNNATVIGNNTSGAYFGYNARYDGAWERNETSAVGILSFTSSGGLTLRTAASGAAGSEPSLAEIVTIKQTGEFGIGRTDPTAPLEVYSGEIATGANKGIRIVSNGAVKKYSIRTGITGAENTSFAIHDDTASANRLTISTAGDVITQGGQLVLSNLASDPGTPISGAMYFNTASDLAYVYNGSSWDQISNVPFGATGGTETTYSAGGKNYKVHTFLTSGTFTPLGSGSVDVLVVGGGGGAGNCNIAEQGGGGGGAGGFITSSGTSGANTSAISQIVVQPQAYTVTVGAGGAAGAFAEDTTGSQGANSNFATVTAIGGGGGGGNATEGTTGGSGGGGMESNGVGRSGTSGQGFAGGSGSETDDRGGGGGGASQAGQNYNASDRSDGGDGLANSLRTGSAINYAGGGAGGGTRLGVASGGTGGGGDAGVAGAANTGGGGGSDTGEISGTAAKAGGSGIVVIRYEVQ